MIKAWMMGDDKCIGVYERIAPGAAQELGKTTGEEAAHLVGYIQKNKLSGFPLRARSGRLRSSIHYVMNPISPFQITAQVGTNVEYAGYHEFGFHGSVQVRAHIREIKSRSTFSREQHVSRKTGRSYMAKVKASQGIAFVKSHSRRVDYAGRPTLRPALEENRERIVQNLTRAVERGAKP